MKINDTNGFKLLTRLRLNFSHINEHKFRHNFTDTISPMSSVQSNELESDFTVVSKFLHFSSLLLSNITLGLYPAMTAAASTPSP